MLTILFYIFLAYMLYQLVFKFIIPVYRTTRQVKRSFREMQERMNAHSNGHPHGRPPHAQSSNKVNAGSNRPEEKTGEYIDFEEIKD